MLRIRIEGHEVETTPALLARLVFDGKVDRHSPAKPPGGAVEQPLEQLLGSAHCEVLTGELHRRLQMLCAMDSAAVDVQELCTQVEHLCQWRWADASLAARFFWAAAWLNELTDCAKSAIDFYNAFLLMPSRESHLRLLALNNRGVLHIRLGRLDGVQDLARAALGEVGGNRTADTDLYAGGLPAACFNLLNLINVSFGAADLLRTLDEELTGFFSRLGPDVQAVWLGAQEEGQRTEAEEESSSVQGLRRSSRPTSHVPRNELRNRPTRDDPSPSVSCPPILRDPTYRRLNSLMTRLAAQAHGLTADSNGQLDYAGAASLLLSDDIPLSLTRPENMLARVEQSALEELAVIEGLAASGQYDLAKSQLQVQRKVLLSLAGPGGLATLLARLDAQLERIARLEAQEEQLRLQRMCAEFVAEVQKFCTLTDVHRAQSVWEDLMRRLQQFQAPMSPQTHGEAIGLLDELMARGRQHVQGLRRAQVEIAVGDALRHVQGNRPSDRTTPVPESVYQALAQCRHHDPENWIDDWAALEEQLDAHQGQYYTHKALSDLRSGTVSWDQAQDDLVQALRYAPDSWAAISPLFGFQVQEGEGRGNRDPKREEIAFGKGSQVRNYALGDPNPTPWVPSEEGQARGPAPTPSGRLSAMDRAGRLLERAFLQIGADTGKYLRLWQCVEKTLWPALAGRDVETLKEVHMLAEKCLDHWPAGWREVPGRADPRNPVNRFLEACEKARCLGEAEQLLDARPPRLDQAKKHLVGILRLGLDTRDQLRRAVTGLYLAQFHEKDAPPLQRQILADLEGWVQAMPQEAVPQIHGQEIVEQTEKVRQKCEV